MKTTLRTLLAVMLIGIFPLHTSAQIAYKDLFHGQFDNDKMWGVSAGWVAKYWQQNINGQPRMTNWFEMDHMLHGLNVGVTFQRVANLGYGIHTGLFFEWYTNRRGAVEEYTLGRYTRYNEYDLYLPVHFMWRIPINEDLCISPYIGFGANWTMAGNWKDGAYTSGTGNNAGSYALSGLLAVLTQTPINPTDYSYNYTDEGNSVKESVDYNNNSPHHWNVQAEFGASIRWDFLQLNLTYSLGMNTHNIYDGITSHENKFNVSLGFFFGDQN